MTTCPCKLAVPLDYSRFEPWQAQIVAQFIADRGEYMDVIVAGKGYRVSRHCIALHGVKAAEIESYGFARL